MTSIKEINSAIMFGNFTNDQLSSITDAVKFARSNLQKQVKRSLSLGSTVKFTSTKTGISYQGSVEKIAQKFVTVNTGTGRWKVPANMLEVA